MAEKCFDREREDGCNFSEVHFIISEAKDMIQQKTGRFQNKGLKATRKSTHINNYFLLHCILITGQLTIYAGDKFYTPKGKITCRKQYLYQ